MTHIIYYLTYSKTGCKQMVAAPGIKNIVDDPCEFVKRIKTNKRLNDKKGQTLQRNKEAQNSQNPEAKATEPKGKGEKKAEKPTASAMELPHAAQDSPGPMGVQTPQILRQTEAIPATTQSRQKPDPIGVRMPVHPSLNGPMSATPTAQQPGLVGIRTPVHSGMNVALTITPESRQNSGVNAVRMPAHSSLNGAISTTPSPQQPGLVAVRTPVNPRPNGIMSTAPSPQQPGLVAVRAPVNPRPNGVMSTTPSPRQPGLMAVQKPMHPSLNGVVSTAPSPQPGLVGVRTPVNSRPNGAISTTPSPQKTNLMGFQTPMHPSPNGAMYTAPSPQKPGIRVVRTPQNPRQNGAIAARQQSPPKPDDLSGFISPEAMQGFITGLSAYDPTPVLREAPVVTASQGAFDGNPATVSRNQMRAATPMMAPASQPMNMPAVMGNVYPYGMQMTPSPAMYHPMFQQNMAMAGFYPSPAVQNPYATPMHSRSTSGASQPSMLGSPYPTPQSFHRGMAASGMENRIPTNMIAAPVPNGPQKRSISQVYGQQYDNLPANKRQC
ncbi:hypothetical protein ASPZODRAFT_134383 [Penicilliopsis zonata CBS 506.65]|uniref:Uncharacterized protein n=1 Tax=Penicilliopsis zonata CBS 506.65 TaxID=1073090 RepID=A0A1L9SCW4_9EURO|nr:hypothetical protein ASPZODRAFT_134383 [Penicilliopsis zonata CBS 506.65]OJJ44963.1 hypothetical protein ASPZODRAFT_134383 [Penicilliopsis zonata CBS 506.65]